MTLIGSIERLEIRCDAHTFSDLQRTPALRMGDGVVRLNNRDRHAVRRPCRISDRDGVSRGWRWKDTNALGQYILGHGWRAIVPRVRGESDSQGFEAVISYGYKMEENGSIGELRKRQGPSYNMISLVST